MPRLSKLIEKIEDRLANKWGCWYERNKARVPLYAVLGGIGWYLYGMFLNSLKLGKESVFNTTGEVIESIWVFNPFKNLFAVFTPFGLGVSAFIALMVCLITKKATAGFQATNLPGTPAALISCRTALTAPPDLRQKRSLLSIWSSAALKKLPECCLDALRRGQMIRKNTLPTWRTA